MHSQNGIQIVNSSVVSFTNLGYDESVGDETKSGKNTIRNKRDGCNRIDDGVDISDPLQKSQPSMVTIPDRTMSAKKNLDRSQSPSKNLVQTIRKIDWCRSLERRAWRIAVDRYPTPGMHLEPSKNIFRHGTIDPTNLTKVPNKMSSNR